MNADIRICPEGKDETGSCNSRAIGWTDATRYNVIVVREPADTDDIIARRAASQMLFGEVRESNGLMFYQQCQVAGVENVPTAPAVEPEPVTTLMTPVSVYDRLSAKIREEMSSKIKGKVADAALGVQVSATFDVKINEAFTQKIASGSESNVLLVSSDLRTAARTLPESVRSQCFIDGRTVVTGVSGFVVVRSTSTSENSLVQAIDTALKAAVDASTLPAPEKQELLRLSFEWSSSIANTVVKSSGFTVIVAQKKFYPVWMEIQRVECKATTQKFPKSATSATLLMTDRDKNDGYWRASGTCSTAGAGSPAENGWTCDATGSEVQIGLNVCRLSRDLKATATTK